MTLPALICCHAPTVLYTEAKIIAEIADSDQNLLTSELWRYCAEAADIALFILVDIDIPLGHAVVNASRLRLRAAPVDGEIIAMMSRETPVTVWGTRGDWAFVITEDDKGGWVSRDYIVTTRGVG